jgi:anthraniloyl-CoA monooxygenase
MLTRSKQVTYDNLRISDPHFVEQVDRWFADGVRAAGFNLAGDPPPMFTPLKLRDMTLANRVVVSPMDMYSAEDGTVGDFHFVHFGAFAHGGAGLIFTEMVCVARDGRITPGCGGLYKPEHVAAWKRVIDYVHANSDAKFAIQIGHAGRKGSTRVAWEGMDKPLADGNWELIGPSPVKHYPFMQTPREMTRADMDRVRGEFVAAARMADQAGADMIELHMAHGYLLSSFITPVANRRTDEYGGSLGNRMRFPLDVFDAVRAVWPREKPMSVRLSATDWVGAGGVTPEDSVEIARLLKAHGCDVIDVSAGQTTPDAKPVYGRMFQTPFAEQIRNEAGIATMAVGNITSWDQVNTIVAAGRADLVCLARPHLVNPHFTLQAAAYYGYTPQRWPKQYESGRDQALRIAPRDRAEIMQLRQVARPPSHRRQRRAAE